MSTQASDPQNEFFSLKNSKNKTFIIQNIVFNRTNFEILYFTAERANASTCFFLKNIIYLAANFGEI